MAIRRTVDLLPEIFQTGTNKQFLAATLDQLTAEPSVKRTQGFVGRRVGPGVNAADNYVVETTAERQDYQLEPGIVSFQPDTTKVIDALTYPGMVDSLKIQGADVTRQDRLFQEQYYTWDPFVDLDKFVNYSQYYWLPGGPDSVDVNTAFFPLTDEWEVTRDGVDSAYTFSDVAGKNPILTLVRGGNYKFRINQLGHNFWIQAAPGVDGLMPGTTNISSRDVLGVVDNGIDLGVIEFNVPDKTAQSFYYGLPEVGPVDLVTNLKFNEINNVYVNEFLNRHPEGIDGITNLENRTVVFLNRIVDATDGGWQVTTQFDPLERVSSNNGLVGSYDTTTFDQTTDITLQSQRYSIWQIQYIPDNDGEFYMRLANLAPVPNLNKFNILFGTTYANTSWYKDATGYFERIPLLTAALDELWYQDADDPAMFGQIKLVDQTLNNPLDISDILGAKDYTSPNGVKFTNGLKVQFRGTVIPESYQNQSYYVEGVGTGPGIDTRVGFIDGEAYFGPFHVYQGQRRTGAVHSDEYFQQNIYEDIQESLDNQGAGGPEGAPLPVQGVPGALLGNGIRLVPTDSLVTPETYTKSATIPFDSLPYDDGPYDAALNAPEIQDYITINRSSRDLNPWSRSNRWFHKQVIEDTAAYNNQIAVLDQAQQGKRPILEFRANIDLFNFGTQGKTPVNIIDLNATDAFSNINGQTGYSLDGYNFINGTRVIFANDSDPDVRNQIYEVQFIDPNLSGTFIIDLVPVLNGLAREGQTVVCLSGNTLQGKSFWFDGSDWISAQQKISVNQAPLFDVFDANGVSLSNVTTYPSTTFAGTKLFSYAIGETDIVDQVLGFSLKFLNINNVGDILFENNFYKDTFLYVTDSVSKEVNISIGFARQYIDRVSFTSLIGWESAAGTARSRQQFRFVYNNEPLILDVPADTDSVFPSVKVFQQASFLNPQDYTVSVAGGQTTVTLINPPAIGTVIEVQVLSDVASDIGFYQVPINLSNNPLNENSDQFTLGTIRSHYQTIGQNLKDISGAIDGSNNTRDLGDISRYGENIVQHASPMPLLGPFLRQRQFEVISAIEFNSREYEKYKARLLDAASRGNYVNSTPTQVLDSVISEIATGRDSVSPFYWSDMLPWGQTYTELVYDFTDISDNVFDLTETFNFTESNYRGLSVYYNGTILQRGIDYTVGVDTPTLTVLIPLQVGDVIKIREYATTYGSFVPNTPSKMGLYPVFKPEMYLDESFVTPTMVIRGHDGSVTVAFGDYRDQVLLEFETRIFNNVKIVTEVPLSFVDVVPGQFRTTDYSLSEINGILAPDFLAWVGWNKLDYPSQTYLGDDPFTYNYSQSQNKLNRQPLLGAWRGIYNYFYDTIYPNTRPWELLGFSQEPYWWESYYGPAPYTDGNLVLWDDLAQGLVRDPIQPYYKPRYARPDLSSVIPAGSEGALVPPIDSVVSNYDATSFRRSWAFGDGGPVENTWRSSSAWPFAVMRLLALTQPAKFFSLFADRDLYKFNSELDQYLYDNRYRLDATRLAPLYGDGTSKASYINWIIDYNRQLGTNGTKKLEIDLSNLGVRLCWRLGGFSDKRYLKIFTERSTPNSLNASLLLPDESYTVLLYKNQPSREMTYSSVIIQRSDTGWQVFGYNQIKPYFTVYASLPNGNLRLITAGDVTARVSVDYSSNTAQVPYGYTFTNVNAVCDFLLSYGRYLTLNGFTFATRENGYTMDWYQMAEEFLYWSGQGWAPGSIINLNPSAVKATLDAPGYVVDSMVEPRPENLILNQNRIPIKSEQMVIERMDNNFSVTTLNQDTINFLSTRLTQFESTVVLDNVSIFADLIYSPVTGARQSRVQVSGIISGDWNGTVNAPGFVLNLDNIIEWQPNKQYTKGEIVLFKNDYWTASRIIEPATKFDYSTWIRADYDLIQKGLLPNAANASDQLATAYDVSQANLETDVDLFSYGLIGFRPRQYMSDLNLDDVSQVQLYQQFLGTKGTIGALEQFNRADLGKETAEYNIYEYWAMLRSSYGATANRNYFEILLNEARLRADPSLVEIVQTQQFSQADQAVLLQDLWKSSEKFTTTNIMPTTLEPETDASLPSAGYVDFEDVDFTVFDLEDFAATSLSLDQQIDELSEGDIIWTAKKNRYDWGVYRLQEVPGDVVQVSDNLNGRSLVTMTARHGLQVNDYIVIRYFDPAVDGTYRVLGVPSLDTLLIGLAFVGTQTQIIGQGVAFTLATSRVAQASDVSTLTYVNVLRAGAKVWVDDNGFGRWTVLEKTDPFTYNDVLPIAQAESSSQFGASVTQGFNNLAAMVGAPGYLQAVDDSTLLATGAVYTYVKTAATNAYEQGILIEPQTEGLKDFGRSMDMGDQTWAVVGAPRSLGDRGYAYVIYNPVATNAFIQSQILLLPDGETAPGALFGQSVTMARDELWLYVGCPGINRVYCYGRQDIQLQSVRYVCDGSTSQFNYTDHVVVNNGTQLAVNLNNVNLTLGVDFTVSGTNINLLTTPTQGQTLIISRRVGDLFIGDGSTTTYSLDDLYLATSIESFSVYINDVIQRPHYDYAFGADSSLDLVFTQAPTNGAVINVVCQTHWKQVSSITVAGLPADAKFGYSVSTSTDGRKLIVGAPGVTNNQGLVYVFDRSTQNFVQQNSTNTAFTTVQSLSNPGAPINVFLNSVLLIDEANNIDGQYSISGNTVTLSAAPAVGDVLTVETNQFTLEQTLVDPAAAAADQYGYAVDQCVNDCSLYVGAPYYGEDIPEHGHVDYKINQGRVYGTLTSSISNCVLTPGQYLSVNNIFVEVSSPGAWNSALSYSKDTIVSIGSDLYQSRVAVPVGTAITNTVYWRPVNWSTVLAQDIVDTAVANVTVAVGENREFVSNGRTQQFNIGDLYSSAQSYTPLVYLDNVLQTLNTNYTYDNSTQTITFNLTPAYDTKINVVGGRLTIAVKNIDATLTYNRLRVGPGTGTVFQDLGLTTYIDVQTITAPLVQDYAHFGKSLFVSETATNLVVGAPEASTIGFATFDDNTTVFDANTCVFSNNVTQSGAVYTFDFLPAAAASASNQGQFVFGQQIYSSDITELERFGTAVDYTTGILLVGAPGEDLGDSTEANYGQVQQFANIARLPAWQAIRTQNPVVDITRLNSVFMYDRFSGASRQYFDFIDPLQGKILGAAQQNIDYTGSVDPAAYNVGSLNNYGERWGESYVGKIWWDTTNARFIDPNQNDIVYASRRWAQLFPGSSVDVYQWVVSDVPPAQYGGPGVVRSTTNYVVLSSINEEGLFGTQYYFWVTGIREVNRKARKTLSIETVARYIQDPKTSGIAYIAPINASTVAIYNGLPYIVAQDTVLHVEFDETANDAPVYVEYQLIPQDRRDGFLTDLLYRKFLDSFCGADTEGHKVPDPFLPVSELYGVQFRPRQSMYANRFLALENYLTRANRVMSLYPISEIRTFPLLQSQEPEPTASSGQWNKRVADYAELTYQDLDTVPIGYKYLVATDSTNTGLWTIYEVVAGALIGSKTLLLVRVQTYDTNLYWNYIDWYLPGYNPRTLISAEVANFNDLAQLDLPPGSVAKVTTNGGNKWEIYLLENAVWTRVGLQDGTIEIKAEIWDYSIGRFGFDVEVFDAQYFDQEPVIETRNIIRSLNEEIFVDDLGLERNRLLVLMFNFILQEQVAPLWLTKTSLIDVDHVIRDLEPYQIYRRDNQDFVLDYIQEVKPYHVQIREFNLIYRGNDAYQGSLTDFDLPAYYDTAEAMFISPVLDDDPLEPLSTTSSVPGTDPVWSTFPWDQWFNNYTLAVESITTVEGGTGYTVAPTVIVGTEFQKNTAYAQGQQLFFNNNLYTVTVAGVSGQSEPRFTSGSRVNGTATLAYAGTRTIAVARLLGGGQVGQIEIVVPGSGYIVTPAVTLEGGNGQGAVAVPVMTGTGIGRDFSAGDPTDPTEIYYTLVRSFTTTIKFDRYEYTSQVVDWQPNVQYDDGTLVRYADKVWSAASTDSTAVVGPTFDPQEWTLVPAGDLNGADRTQGYYTPGPNEPGLDLALLMTGIDYPGVQVDAPDFNQNTGFDVGNYDINPYDNISYGPEGRPTYDPAILDAIYESYFGTPATGPIPTGTADTDINVDGGAFVDTYESHAPEELVPGIIFDTLDLRVFTTPGADWQMDGHGFPLRVLGYAYDSTSPVYTWANLVDYPTVIEIYNATWGLRLIRDVQFTVNWPARTVTILGGIVDGESLQINVYGLGGGNQVWKDSIVGNEVNAGVIVEYPYSQIDRFAIYVNGEPTTAYTFSQYSTTQTKLTFNNTYDATQLLTIAAMGLEEDSYPHDWSAPVIQAEIADGSTLTWTLDNSVQGTNPANLVVEVNGRRARPPEGIQWTVDGSSRTYFLPNRGGYDQGLIGNNEVYAWIDNTALTYGVQFVLDPYDGSSDRTITLSFDPEPGAQLLISVDHAADYYLDGTTLIYKPTASLLPLLGDTVTFTTFNDTSQQNILTQVFVGPTTQGSQINVGYDTTRYDQGTPFVESTFDEGTGTVILTNVFDTGRTIDNPNRLIVTLDNEYLFPNQDWYVDGTAVVISGPPINPASVVAITNFTQSITPDAEAFRIFQDMRGEQLAYRITPETTTKTVAQVMSTSDVIYVAQVNHLSQPNLPDGIFGQITIDGERITYRFRETAALEEVSTGQSIYTLGGANYALLGQGTLTAVLVTPGGTEVSAPYVVLNNDDWIAVQFLTVPPIGYTVRVSFTIVGAVFGLRRGTAGTGASEHAPDAWVYDIGLGNLLPAQYQNQTYPGFGIGGYDLSNYDMPTTIAQSWYQPGNGTPSNGQPLQVTNTLAARFIRGE